MPDTLITSITLLLILFTVPITVLFSWPIKSPTLIFAVGITSVVVSVTGIFGVFTGSII